MITVADVKQTAILEVAEALGLHFKPLSGSIYEHPEHDSFRIFVDTNTFKWFSRDIQGDVIDFVQLVAAVSFKEALSFLKTGDFQQQNFSKPVYQPFQYYLKEEAFSLARYYLKEGRGLSDDTIKTFVQEGLLSQGVYRTKSYQESVLAFKSYDHKGQLQGASLQGLIKYPERHDHGFLKKTMKGSHGHIGISLDIGQPKRLIFGESVIDMMSYYELHQNQLSDVRLVSMEGLKQSVIAYQTLRLIADQQQKREFLDTVNPYRLSHYLNALLQTTSYFQMHPGVITLVVDNDKAGREFCQKLADRGLAVEIDLPALAPHAIKSDWNDVLKRNKDIDLASYIQGLEKMTRQESVSNRATRTLEL